RLDQAVFILVNVGIIGFVIGLLGDWDPFKHAFTPIMGLGLLLALVIYALRLTDNKARWLR
ncbi:MAG TPA: hypothetical protein PKD27_10735, partial [Tepidiformaceae bacterium]|nr:hypothetical protein [Tepidiformaceae bacterium]HMO96585.1 hypothetical protein [Tepidiformaceae bacterium]